MPIEWPPFWTYPATLKTAAAALRDHRADAFAWWVEHNPFFTIESRTQLYQGLSQADQESIVAYVDAMRTISTPSDDESRTALRAQEHLLTAELNWGFSAIVADLRELPVPQRRRAGLRLASALKRVDPKSIDPEAEAIFEQVLWSAFEARVGRAFGLRAGYVPMWDDLWGAAQRVRPVEMVATIRGAVRTSGVEMRRSLQAASSVGCALPAAALIVVVAARALPG